MILRRVNIFVRALNDPGTQSCISEIIAEHNSPVVYV